MKGAGTSVNFLIGFVNRLVYLILQFRPLLFIENFFGDQQVAIETMKRRSQFDTVVHERLGEIRLIAFIMAISAKGNQVDDDILAEFLTVFRGKPSNMHRRLRVFTLNVKYRSHEHFGYIGGITCGAGIFGKGGITDLVVDNDVDRAGRGIALQLG